MYFDCSKILSYNKIMNFVLGNRGGGKSYNAKKWAINDFIKNGKQFVYVRRYKEELKKKDLFFDDIKQEFPNVKFKVEGNKAYINKKLCGHFIALSTSAKEKSTPYPNVNKLLFDEFIVDHGGRYLKNEVEVFLDLFETVARSRDDVRALFLANSVSQVNPYFAFFNLKIDKSKEFNTMKGREIVVQYYTNKEFIEMKKKTRFGKMIEGTAYGKYAIENEFLRDNNAFVNKDKGGHNRYLASYKFMKEEVALWYNPYEGSYYFNKQVNPNNPQRYVIMKEDHDVNYKLISDLNGRNSFRALKRAFGMGGVEFETLEIKLVVLKLMEMFK